MDSPLELPIFISYRPPKRVVAFNTLVHAGAVFCLLLADVPQSVALLGGVGILVHVVFYLEGFLHPETICFKLNRGERWQLLRAGCDAIDLELLPGALVHPRIVVLCFKEPGGRLRSCVLTHDNLDARTLRRLRVRLRWPCH